MKRALVLSFTVFLMLSCNVVVNTPASWASATPKAAQTAVLQEPTAVQQVDIPNATIAYYDISGVTAQDLRKQLNDLGPVGYDKYKGDATTNWFIKWNWPGYGTASCDLSAATVSYNIQVIFPRWLPPQNADAEVVAKWNAYIQALATHEKGHADFVVDHYLSVLDAIQNATCETADAEAKAALEPIRKHDVDYDAATAHGATQGARFP